MARSVLVDARRLFARRRHAEVIGLLEPNLPLFRESHEYYYLLGASCLRTGDMGGANTYLRRAEQLDPRDGDTKLCLAALHLRHGESEKAIALYLRVLEDRPRDPLARRCMELMRRADFHERAASMTGSREILSLLPGSRGLPPWLIPALGVLALVVLLYLSIPLVGALAARIQDAASPRQDVAAVTLSGGERASPVASVGSSRYILTEKQALASFDRAKELFQHYRDNAARVEINRLLESNASTALKVKAKTLSTFVQAPDWRSLTDVPVYAQVRADPYLYRDCAVIWRGRAANIHGKAGDRTFDFLVGYDERKNLEGIVSVHVSDSALPIPADAAFELLATISPLDGSFALEAVALHELQTR
ncbi:MAG TPA: tetratricopeptide repeat protein [Rectinemataceae bacterium]|nr:tetratricopeptide repeat protein [Rectinemataceae bacterium]